MNNKPKLIGIIFFTVISVSSFQQAHAKLFKCVSAKGDVFYNDKPCPATEKETLIKADKAPKNAYIPPAFVSDEEKASLGVATGGNVSNQQIKTKGETKDKKEKSFDGSEATKKDASEQSSNESSAGDNSDTQENYVSKSTIEKLKNTTRTKAPLSRKSANNGLASNPLKVEKKKEVHR